jgi:hypothetical protein
VGAASPRRPRVASSARRELLMTRRRPRPRPRPLRPFRAGAVAGPRDRPRRVRGVVPVVVRVRVLEDRAGERRLLLLRVRGRVRRVEGATTMGRRRDETASVAMLPFARPFLDRPERTLNPTHKP